MAQEIRYWIQEAIKNDSFLADWEREKIMFLPFDILNVLEPQEPKYNQKGEKISKDYYYCFEDPSGALQERLAVQIRYVKIYENVEKDGVTISNVWVKTQRVIDYYKVNGGFTSKVEKPQRFNLKPIYKGDGTGTLIGFSSLKQRKFLKDERYSADEDMQVNNLDLYELIYVNYETEYSRYLKFGKKDSLVAKIDADNDFDLTPFMVDGALDPQHEDYAEHSRLKGLQDVFATIYRDTTYTVLQAIKGALQ